MTVSPCKKYMAVASQYQLRLLLARSWRARLGMLARAMTSLKDTICTAVMTRMMYRWPMKRAEKKAPIMMKLHSVRVMKFAFFFS